MKTSDRFLKIINDLDKDIEIWEDNTKHLHSEEAKSVIRFHMNALNRVRILAHAIYITYAEEGK
jgi:hypothetical protein